MIITREMLYGTSCEMLQKKMVVYKIRSLIDDKIYIGKTSKMLKVRILGHLNNKRNCHIDNALKKHGLENFDISIVEECQTLEELNEREKYWIREFNCKIPNGYNATDGGEGKSGYKAPPELCEYLSKIAKGRKHTEKSRQLISKALTGKTHSAESRAKMSAHCKNKRPVICLETKVIFESIAAAAKFAGVTVPSLSAALHGKTKSAGRYHWRFLDEYNPDEEVDLSSPRGARTILCVEKNIVFKSMYEAAKWAGVDPKNIKAVLNNPSRTAANFHWVDADADIENMEFTTGRTRPVKCVETGVVFSSIKDAADWAKTNCSNIRRALNNPSRTAANFHWVDTDVDIENMEFTTRKYHAVKCVETGEVFKSIYAAAKWANITCQNIHHALNHETYTAGGYHWVDVESDENSD